MMNRTRGAVGSLAVAALLGVTLAGGGHATLAQETTPTATAVPQTEADAAAAALSTGKYPYGTELMLLNGTASVRNSAGSEAAILTEIEEGATVTVLAGPEPVGGVDWYKVDTEGGISGWVPVDQFGIAKGGAVLPAGTEREIRADSLNLRAGPGSDTEIISGLVQGDSVTIVSGPNVADDLDWYQVETAFGEQGWLAGVYLGAPGGSDAVGADSAATDAAFLDGSYVFVNAETLDLRTAPSSDAEIVSQLTDGAIGIVTGAPTASGEDAWYPVTFGTGDSTVVGFVDGSGLSGGITVGTDAVVADGPLNVRDDTTVDSDPIALLETGDTVQILNGPTDIDGVAWFEIQSGDTNGFVVGRYLGPAPAVGASE